MAPKSAKTAAQPAQAVHATPTAVAPLQPAQPAVPATETETAPSLQLPVLVSSPVDVGRLLREAEVIDDTLLQLGLRKSGTEVKMPKTTQLMDQIVELNKLNLLVPEDRKQLQAFLESVKSQAPVLHISFSADANTAFIEKLMAWLRREIHPLVLITIGLQPNLGAGCVVRSINKYFDMSLREDFRTKRELLQQALAPLSAPAPADAAAPQAPAQPAAGAAA